MYDPARDSWKSGDEEEEGDINNVEITNEKKDESRDESNNGESADEETANKHSSGKI